MASDESPLPVFAFEFSRLGRISSTALPPKGTIVFDVKWYARQFQSVGVRNFINHSDGGSPLNILKEAAARLVPNFWGKPP